MVRTRSSGLHGEGLKRPQPYWWRGEASSSLAAKIGRGEACLWPPLTPAERAVLIADLWHARRMQRTGRWTDDETPLRTPEPPPQSDLAARARPERPRPKETDNERGRVMRFWASFTGEPQASTGSGPPSPPRPQSGRVRLEPPGQTQGDLFGRQPSQQPNRAGGQSRGAQRPRASLGERDRT